MDIGFPIPDYQALNTTGVAPDIRGSVPHIRPQAVYENLCKEILNDANSIPVPRDIQICNCAAEARLQIASMQIGSSSKAIIKWMLSIAMVLQGVQAQSNDDLWTDEDPRRSSETVTMIIVFLILAIMTTVYRLLQGAECVDASVQLDGDDTDVDALAAAPLRGF